MSDEWTWRDTAKEWFRWQVFDNIWKTIWGTAWGKAAAVTVMSIISAVIAYIGHHPHLASGSIGAVIACSLILVPTWIQARRAKPSEVRQQKFVKFPSTTPIGGLSPALSDLEHYWIQAGAAYSETVRAWNSIWLSMREIYGRRTLSHAEQEHLKEAVGTEGKEHVMRAARILLERIGDLYRAVEKLIGDDEKSNSN